MIVLELASPFWEDPATLTADGDDEVAVMRICINALALAGYDVQVREGETLIPWEEWDPETPDA